MTITYAKVRVQNLDGDRTTVRLRNPVQRHDWIQGIEVDANGNDIEPAGADQRLHLIDNDCVIWVRPLYLDLRYGQLTDCAVEATKASASPTPLWECGCRKCWSLEMDLLDPADRVKFADWATERVEYAP